MQVITIGRFLSLRVSMSQSTGEKWGGNGVYMIIDDDWGEKTCLELLADFLGTKAPELCPLPDNTKVVMNVRGVMSVELLNAEIALNLESSSYLRRQVA